MAFYDLDKTSRQLLVDALYKDFASAIQKKNTTVFSTAFSDEDTYIRKAAYLNFGKLYFEFPGTRDFLLYSLTSLFTSENEKIRQTVVNAAGEIGKQEFEAIAKFMEEGLSDPHPIVRNAVIGSLKKMGEKNPVPTLAFAKRFLHHPDKEIRREICHGIELRGRTHPQDILPLLQELEFDKTARVKNTLVHVLGQISYKKGCLATVVAHLKTWENKEIVQKALLEIIDVHERYAAFSVLTQQEAVEYIQSQFDISSEN